MRTTWLALLIPLALGCGRPAGKLVATLHGHTGMITGLALAPDGKALATGSRDGTIRLWDLDAEKETAQLGMNEGKWITLTFTPDGKTLVSAAIDRPKIKLWDVPGRKMRGTLDAGGGVGDVAVSPDGALLAAGGASDNVVRLWDLKEEKQAGTLEGHTGNLREIAFSPDGKTLASAATIQGPAPPGGLGRIPYEGEIKLWDVASRSERLTMRGHEYLLLCVAYAPEGGLLATGDDHGFVKLWDAATGKERATLNGHSGPNTSVSDLAFSPDGKVLATASLDHTVLLWNVANHRTIGVLKGDLPALDSAVFTPDGRRIVTSHQDGSIRVWDVSLLVPRSEK
jgi:WD40 repeat protein